MKPLLMGLLMLATSVNAQIPTLSAQDVIWTTPSKDAAGSMPIGNGEVVLNVWVEGQTGDLLILIGRTDSLSEISRVLKVGRVRVKFNPPLFNKVDFKQHLKLEQGVIEFYGSEEKLTLFVDPAQDVIHLTGNFKTPRQVTAVAESWRTADRPLPKEDMRSAWAVHDAPFPLIESADAFVNPSQTSVTWRHHNATSVVPKLWENQSLTGLEGSWDPLTGRTFGARIIGEGMSRSGADTLISNSAQSRLDISIATHTSPDLATWEAGLENELRRSITAQAARRNTNWWKQFWERSWVFASETPASQSIPDNNFPLRKGVDSGGGNRFPGEISEWWAWDSALDEDNLLPRRRPSPHREGQPFHPKSGLSLFAKIRIDEAKPGRIFDKLTAGTADGFLFDTHPGRSLRLIVGSLEVVAKDCLNVGKTHQVAATYDAATGVAKIYLDNKIVAEQKPEPGSAITRGYVLQRYANAIQGRGEFPIKFNGGYFCVEPTAMGNNSNPDFRNWGDSHWFQNVRHTVHPMLASGDFEVMDPFFKLYEKSRKLAESRTKLYHNAKGAYFPETMTVFGTYSGGDYGWDRTGLQPKDVQCPWWDDCWNQGPELLDLMLARWEYTRDEGFLRSRVLPMAVSLLQYFDTRFKKDPAGKIILDPTQSVETYWYGVVNDMPTVAGLIEVTDRLVKVPVNLKTANQQKFFLKMRDACPDLPIHSPKGLPMLSPAQKFEPRLNNVENPELYGIWPFRLACLNRPKLLNEAKRAYTDRKNRLDAGWGYDGNVAALLGLTDEAARIMRVKASNSHPAYRWPATWGPNFDWLPDQNHGGNLMNTLHLMLLQCEPMELGGTIRILPAWPKDWDVSFKLRAPENTVVECVYKGGKVERLIISPESRRKDLVVPAGN